MDMPKPGHFEHDAKVWWHDFLCEITPGKSESLLSSFGDRDKRYWFLCSSVDANGQPLRPAILYGIDTRATREIEYLEAILVRRKFLRRVECI